MVSISFCVVFLAQFMLGSNLTLDQVTYADKWVFDLIIESYSEIEFVGVSSNIQFDAMGDVPGAVDISQQQGVLQYYIYFVLIFKFLLEICDSIVHTHKCTYVLFHYR